MSDDRCVFEALPARALVQTLGGLDSVDLRALSRTCRWFRTVLYWFHQSRNEELPANTHGEDLCGLWGSLVLVRFPDFVAAIGGDGGKSDCLETMLGGSAPTAVPAGNESGVDPSALGSDETLEKLFPAQRFCEPEVKMNFAPKPFAMACLLETEEEPHEDPAKAAEQEAARTKRNAILPKRRLGHRLYMLYRFLERARMSPEAALEAGLRSFQRTHRFNKVDEGWVRTAPSGHGVCGPHSLFANVSDWCGVLQFENELRQRLATWVVKTFEDPPAWACETKETLDYGMNPVRAWKRAKGEPEQSGGDDPTKEDGQDALTKFAFGRLVNGFEFNWESHVEGEGRDSDASENDDEDPLEPAGDPMDGNAKSDDGGQAPAQPTWESAPLSFEPSTGQAPAQPTWEFAPLSFGPSTGQAPAQPTREFAPLSFEPSTKAKKPTAEKKIQSPPRVAPGSAEGDAMKFVLKNMMYTQCRLEASSEWNTENYKWDLILACNTEVVLLGLAGQAVVLTFVGRSDYCYWSFGGDGIITARILPVAVALHYVSSALGSAVGTVGIRTDRETMNEILGYQKLTLAGKRVPPQGMNIVDTSKKKNRLDGAIDFVVETADVDMVRNALGLPDSVRPSVLWRACALALIPDSGYMWEQTQTMYSPHASLCGRHSDMPYHPGIKNWSR